MASIVHLLPDIPTTQDAFGTHSRVATAVSELITSEKTGKAVALIGPWGSGKSSVLHMVQARLTGIADVFIFDAWTHEGDPLRRTFLEALIGSLWLDNLSAEIQSLRDEITLRKTTNDETVTPVLTWESKILGFSLLLVPIGLAMFAAMVRMKEPSWPLTITALIFASLPLIFIGVLGLGVGLRKTVLGLSRSSRMISILIAIALLIGLSLVVFRSHGWMTRLGQTRLILLSLPIAAVILLAVFRSSISGILPILLNRTVTTTRSVSIGSSEPSSVEFQRWFRSIVTVHFKQRPRPLVIAIDNLDRIDRALARQVWTTMRIFFELSSENQQEMGRIWLLAAFDKQAIHDLWPVDDPDLFIKKTFQASFSVPSLVLIHRDDYLKKQLRAAFPFCGDPQLDTVVRLYALKHARDIATPRDIISFVNAVGSIHRQWRLDEIPLINQAQYVLAAENDTDVMAVLNSASTTSWSPEELVGSDWQQSLAAIHFNVPPKDVVHVFMPPAIIDGLISGDVTKFANLARIRGFSNILFEVVMRNAEAWKQPTSLSNAIVALEALRASENDNSINTAWRIFTIAASRIEKWDPTAPTGLAFSILLQRSSNDEHSTRQLLRSAGRAFPRASDGSIDNSEEALSRFLKALEPVFNILASLPSDRELVVPGSAITYLNLLTALNKTNKGQILQLLSRLDTDARDEIPRVLGDMIKNIQLREGSYPIIKVISAHYPQLSWEPVTIAAESIFSNSSNNFLQSGFKATFEILLTLANSVEQAAKYLGALAHNGILYHYLGTADGPQSKDFAVLMLLLFSDGLEPTSCPGNARQGVSRFQEWLLKPDASTVGSIARLAASFGQAPRLKSRAEDSDFTNEHLQTALQLVAKRKEISEN